MSLHEHASLILRKTRKFVSAQHGNVAVIFALSIIPLLAAVGVAIDYSRANATKTAMQEALDATAISLAHEAANDTNTQLKTNAQKYFLARFNPEKAKYGATSIAVTAKFNASGSKSLVATASANVPTTFLKIIGYDKIAVGSSSTVKWSEARLRVALVLDNDASMAQSGKMIALKKAAKKLLRELEDDATNNDDDIYVSIIPFAKDVNVGASNVSASWIDWKEWDAKNGTCTGGHHDDKSREYGSSHGSMESTEDTCTGTWKPENHRTWRGCVEDRGDETGPDAENDDTNVNTPDARDAATLYEAEKEFACPQEAMGLSDDWRALETEIDKMSSAGETNQPIGLQMGWMSLAGEGPFTAPTKQPGYTYKQIIILVADHPNSEDRWYKSESEIDARESMTCDNIEAAEDTIYTVQISTDGTSTSPTLQKCASDSSKFFYLTSTNEIDSTFDQIGSDLKKFYIAK